ncbi:(2Fe-2S)-binding protein [Planctomicrobium sp. SH664]|uniref:(2Fe-2S)-binding protein n=1 Tax=Planctomicrobium sp. SH664 TaxID=3448125 RepID=UPI003F5BAE61
MELDDQVCYCFHVSQRKILNFLRVRKPQRASQISECGGAGTGCGWCVPYLKKFFKQSQQASVVGEETITAAEYERQRAAYILAGKGTPPSGSAGINAESRHESE